MGNLRELVEAEVMVGSQRQVQMLPMVVVDDAPPWIAWDAAQQAWLEAKRRRSNRDNTVRAYSLAVRQFFEFALVEPWNVSPMHAHAWAADMGARGLSQSSIGLKLAALSSLYDFVQRKYTVTTPDRRQVTLWPADRANPFVTVERPHISPYGRARYPTTE